LAPAVGDKCTLGDQSRKSTFWGGGEGGKEHGGWEYGTVVNGSGIGKRESGMTKRQKEECQNNWVGTKGLGGRVRPSVTNQSFEKARH